MSLYTPFNVFTVCPKCGSRYFARKDEKSFCCDNCGFTFYVNMSSAVVALIRNNANELLFTTRRYDPAKGMLDLPGGFVNLHESAENAVKREIKEELNLLVTEMRYFGSYPNTYIFNNLEYYTLDLVFNCKVQNFNDIQADDDVLCCQFINPETLDLRLIGLESIKNVIRAIREK